MHFLTFVAAGVASWFYALHDYGVGDHFCAMNHVRVGSHVRIVNDDNRRESACTIVGTGPFVAGRIIDVSPAVRDELGMSGLANVRVYLEVK